MSFSFSARAEKIVMYKVGYTRNNDSAIRTGTSYAAGYIWNAVRFNRIPK